MSSEDNGSADLPLPSPPGQQLMLREVCVLWNCEIQCSMREMAEEIPSPWLRHCLKACLPQPFYL
jgi:hypothetical protein